MGCALRKSKPQIHYKHVLIPEWFCSWHSCSSRVSLTSNFEPWFGHVFDLPLQILAMWRIAFGLVPPSSFHGVRMSRISSSGDGKSPWQFQRDQDDIYQNVWSEHIMLWISCNLWFVNICSKPRQSQGLLSLKRWFLILDKRFSARPSVRPSVPPMILKRGWPRPWLCLAARNFTGNWPV